MSEIKSANNLCSFFLQSVLIRIYLADIQFISVIFQPVNYKKFLGPRGPLRTPLVPVPSRPVVPLSATKIPDSKLTQPLISFPSDSKLKQPLPQYTVHRTLNRINSRTFLAQFGLVPSVIYPLYLHVIIDFGHIWGPFMAEIEKMCQKSAFLVVPDFGYPQSRCPP